MHLLPVAGTHQYLRNRQWQVSGWLFLQGKPGDRGEDGPRS